MTGDGSTTSGGGVAPAAAPGRVALIPGVLALLPQHASLEDPIADLRAAVLRAAAWLSEDVEILATAQGRRVAESVLAARTTTGGPGRSVLVVANGSACRTEKAPGFLDERAEAFDAALARALTAPDPDALRALDGGLAQELWADVAALPALADALAPGARTVAVDHDAAPYGVQYWVVRWACPQGGA